MYSLRKSTFFAPTSTQAQWGAKPSQLSFPLVGSDTTSPWIADMSTLCQAMQGEIPAMTAVVAAWNVLLWEGCATQWSSHTVHPKVSNCFLKHNLNNQIPLSLLALLFGTVLHNSEWLSHFPITQANLCNFFKCPTTVFRSWRAEVAVWWAGISILQILWMAENLEVICFDCAIAFVVFLGWLVWACGRTSSCN